MSQDIFDFLTSSTSSASDYLKLKNGDRTSVRLLSEPVVGMEVFIDGKPVRWRHDQDPPVKEFGEEKPKKFMAFVVYQYGDDGKGSLKVWSFSQKSIREQVVGAFQWDAVQKKFRHHWGAIELNLTRNGSGLDTKYTVVVIQRPCEDELRKFARMAKDYVDLTKLFTGENPFLKELPTITIEEAKPETSADDLPF